MADSNHRRSRRPDSKQMWDESESSHSARDSRDREPRRDYRDDRDKRGRNYRSRSRERRDDRDRSDRRGGRGYEGRERGGYQGRDGRDSRDGNRGQFRDEGRSKPRSRSRERRRSGSPKVEKDLPLRSTENGSRLGSGLPTGPRAGRSDEKMRELGRIGSEPRSTGIAIKSKDIVEEPESYEDDDIVVEEDDGLAAMQAMMGFGGFGTTKQKKVPGNDVSAVRKEKKTEYRQYMNRVGGFNRPLSPPRE